MINVLVTGGSRGIGRAVVEEFSKNSEYRVFFTYLKSKNAAEELAAKTGAIPICSDIRGDCDTVKDTIHRFGKASIIVNNAGVAQQKLFQDITDSDFDNMFDTNIRGMFLLTRALADDLIFQKKGAIINVASMWGIAGASCEVHYSASKAAVIGFTKALAKELGPSGITVNCVAPGVIDTDMNACFDKETLDALSCETPLGRLGKPWEVAKLICFLASDDAKFITGQIIAIDGGFIL